MKICAHVIYETDFFRGVPMRPVIQISITLMHTDAQLQTPQPPTLQSTTTTKCNCKALCKSSHQRCAVTWLPPLITGLQRQWAQWVQRRSFQMTSDPPLPTTPLGKRHGSPIAWEEAAGAFQAMGSEVGEQDCPHNYITAFERPLWAARSRLGRTASLFHISARQPNVPWQIWPCRELWPGVVHHRTGNPLHLSAYEFVDLKAEGGRGKTIGSNAEGQRQPENPLGVKEIMFQGPDMNMGFR